MSVQAPSSPDEGDTLIFRPPVLDDGAALWALAGAAGGLDVNSPYAYLMLGAYLAPTSIVAADRRGLAGFVSGLVPPGRDDTLFVWQVGVHPTRRGERVGTRMLLALSRRLPSARFIETTVTPSNGASLALFDGLARRLGTGCARVGVIGRDMFPNGDHEEELVLRIGPFHQQGDRP
jgi:L-2,4-diaminobutyric acid acetyltransferase